MTVPSFLVNEALIIKGIKKVEKMFAQDVVHIRHSIGESWIGEPALHLRVLLCDQAAKRLLDGAKARRPDARELPERIEAAVRQIIDPLGRWGLYPFFNYRSASEQADLRTPDWE